MARRGRRRQVKLNVKKETLQSAAAIILLLLAGIILISLFAPGYSLNHRVNIFVVSAFGYGAILLPLVLVVGGLIQARIVKSKFVELRVLFGLVGILLGVVGISALIGDKGGSVGGGLAGALGSAVSSVGAFLIFLGTIAGSVIFMSDLSFPELGEKLGAFVSSIKGSRFGKKGSPKDEIKITTGEPISSEDSDVADAVEVAVELPEPIFEVIPSLAEPKSLGGRALPGEGAHSATIAPGLPYSDKVWEAPPLDLLADPSNIPVDRGDVKQRAQIIVDTLGSFGVVAEVAEINYGPSVTQYALRASSGTRIARASSLQHDLALAMASPTGSVRIEAPIPGKSLIGIEVPNNISIPVPFKEILISDPMKAHKSKLAVVLGKDVSGAPLVYDIGKMPHLLVAGATGSGKSVFLHSLIFSLLYRCSPQECKFIFVDPKRVELVHYKDIPHLLTPVVTDVDKAASVFRWAASEMERRYKLLETAKVRNIDGYNEKSGFQALPYIIIVVDELAEIMVADPAQVEKSIIRLAQLARATGIHLVLTVQRPSTNVITGLIKANIPCRIAFNVASQIDSRVIIDQPGAEKLLGKGDMLFVPPDMSRPIRLQGAFVSEKEVASLVDYLKSRGVAPDYREEIFQVQSRAQNANTAYGSDVDELFD